MFANIDRLRERGSAPALFHKGDEISYARLAEMAEGFAHRQPAKASLVAVEMEATPVAVAAYLGALAAGHAVMPLPAGRSDLFSRLEDRFRPSATWRRLGDGFRIIRHDHQPASVHPDLALLLQTSGSTGEGRGVRLSLDAVQSNAAAIAQYLELQPSDRAALVLPLHYSYGLSVLHSHLASGASVWLAEMSVLDPAFAQELAGSGATSLAGVPHHFSLLSGAGLAESLPERIDSLTVAGGAMAPDAVRRWASIMKRRNGRFFVMYGQTEAVARIAYLPPHLAESHPEAVGKAIPGGSLLLRDGAGRELKEGEAEGELIYRGPNVMMGYAEAANDLAKGPELSELATGDVAKRGKDGLYRITGRLSRMSKIAGLRIGHDALERALSAAGHEAAVWGNDEGLQIAVRGQKEGVAAFAARLSGVGEQHFHVVPCSEFPRHANGKIDYPALKRLEQPRTVRGKGLLRAFERTFSPRPISRQDSFASLGGDSLQHVELSLVLDRQLDGVPAQWERLTIEQLEHASAAAASRSAVATPVLARALAILAVVVAHQTFWPVYGGAAAMVILLGMSIAQHRSQELVYWRPGRFLKPTQRVLLPYLIVLAGFTLAWGQMPWASLFLISNLGFTTPESHLMLPYLYWFIEAYVQITLMVLLLFWPRPMRQLLASRPFMSGIALLALGVVLRAVPEIWPLEAGRSQFTVPWVFFLFALGWCVAFARSSRQRVLTLLAATILLPAAAYFGGNWYGSWSKYLSLLVLVSLLLYVPQVPLPRFLVRGVMYLAQAAFMIYLLHRLVPEVLLPLSGLEFSSAITDILSIVGGTMLGLLAAAAQRHVSLVKGALTNVRRSFRRGTRQPQSRLRLLPRKRQLSVIGVQDTYSGGARAARR
nr:AMP-dependent synthetase [arsenite-oxidising bacterium NT-25]